MISFKQFLTENDDFNLEKFKSDCEFFLSKVNGANSLLWRGIRGSPNDYSVNTFTQRTRPVDMRLDIHTFLNAYYKQKIGFPIRNWLFTTGNEKVADQYVVNYSDKPSAIFPIGQFSWFCFKDKKLKDLWVYIDDIKSRIDMVFKNKKAATFEFYDSLELALDSAEYWFNTDLQKCINSGNEIMILCDKYYVFNTNPDNESSAFNTKVYPYLIENKIIKL